MAMTKRLVDVDDEALDAARSHLGTRTIKDTVNESLRLVAADRSRVLADAVVVLARAGLADRADAWR